MPLEPRHRIDAPGALGQGVPTARHRALPADGCTAQAQAQGGTAGNVPRPLPFQATRVRQRFADRAQAGRELARVLAGQAWPDPVVLALPRGGLPVALEVARALRAPLDLLLVRKIGAPGQPELAVGALAWWPAAPPPGLERQSLQAAPATGMPARPAPSAPTASSSPSAPSVPSVPPVAVVLDAGLMVATGADQAFVDRAVQRERAELLRRQQRYLHGRSSASLKGRTAIVVDDGLATGTTMRAALQALQALRAGAAEQEGPQAVVLAVPVAPAEVLAALEDQVDAVVCLWTPEPFIAVGAHYRAFAQVSDEEVEAALRQAPGAASRPQA